MSIYHRSPASATAVQQPTRSDEPSLRDVVRDALISIGLMPLRDFRTETTGPAVRVSFSLGAIPSVAWDVLANYDMYSDGPSALRVTYRGDLLLSSVEEGRVAA